MVMARPVTVRAERQTEPSRIRSASHPIGSSTTRDTVTLWHDVASVWRRVGPVRYGPRCARFIRFAPLALQLRLRSGPVTVTSRGHLFRLRAPPSTGVDRRGQRPHRTACALAPATHP